MSNPSFQFYPADWLSSQRVQLMSLEEEGAYIRLLCYCWNHGRIPADPEKITRIIGKGASTTLASTLATMFQPDASDPSWLVHRRLDAERDKQQKWREKAAAGGRKSAEIRAKFKGGSTTVGRVVGECLPNGSNQNATLQSSTSVEVVEEKKPADAGDEFGEIFWVDLQRQYPEVSVGEERLKMFNWYHAKGRKPTTRNAITWMQKAPQTQLPILAIGAAEKAAIASREKSFEDTRAEMQRLAEEERRRREAQESGVQYVEEVS